MRLLTVQVLGVLVLCYQGVAALTDAPAVTGNDDDFGPGNSTVSKVSGKHGKTAAAAVSRIPAVN
jgi:hypothetical protein